MEKNAKTIGKLSFIDHLCKNMGCTSKEAKVIYEAFMKVLIQNIIEENEIILTGFGKFTVSPHKGHHVHFTDENDKKITDYLTIKFKPSVTLRRKINSNRASLPKKV